jgi:glycine/D-amino acid oxidase-like deaminating enzyme
MPTDVIVIGGGCTGASTAFQLARRGRRVVLVERDTVGSGPTARSIGIIRLHYSHEPLIRLAIRSLRMFTAFEELTGGTADFVRAGFLLLAAPAQMDALRANVRLQHAAGADAVVLSSEEVHRLDPRMNTQDTGGAAYEAASGVADGYTTTASFGAGARRYGAEIREATEALEILVEGGRVRGVRTSRGLVEAPVVLVAAGPWTPALLSPLGVDVPIQSSRQQVVQVAPPPGFGAMRFVLEDMIQGFYARGETGGTVLAGVLEEDAGEIVQTDAFNTGVDFDFVERVGRLFAHRFPGAAAASVRGGYASLYDVTPDWQPILGSVDGVAGLFIAAGFSGHGFKLSPALGEALAALLTGEIPEIDISMFHLSRFTRGALLRGRHSQGILG